ncbi:MAG: GNAT family N-acetyltransferase [Casimicrobium sp.]
MNCAASEVPVIDTDRRGKPVSMPVAAIALTPITTADRRLEYCLALARDNMKPYLLRRGQEFDETRWRNLAPQASFFLISNLNLPAHHTVGFLSVRDEPDGSNVLHIGDVQLEAQHRNRGVGWTTLALVESMAQTRGLNELTLNVFRDNPALRLYERFGFRCVETQIDKHKMRKTLAHR